MIHPSELLRTDIQENNQNNREFSAPIDSVRYNLDCGLNALPCFNRYLEKYAKPSVFITILCSVGFLHGANLIYFRNTSQIWGEQYNISKDSLEWFTYINEVLVGFVALFVSYWGNRIHRPTWIGSFTIFLSIFSLCLIICELYVDEKENNTLTKNVYDDLKEANHIAIAMLIAYQLFYALADICVLSLGISYVDDNVLTFHSPSAIGLILAAPEIGKQAGAYFSWIPVSLDFTHIFFTSIWLTISISLFIIGVLITMFPKMLPLIMTRKNAASLLSLASGNVIEEKQETVDGFFTTLLRLLNNKIFIINLISFTLLQSAIINFEIFEIIFNQTKYHVPKYDISGYHDPSLIQFTTNLLKQPLVCISIVACGFVIAKSQPRARKLVVWNIIVSILIILFFASTKFFDCTNGLASSHDTVLLTPACSVNIDCPKFEQFHPVCVDREKTYYSPCSAGCEPTDTDFQIYKNCSCAIKTGQVIEGSCDLNSCTKLLAIAQVNNIISSGLLATTIITSILINIRCILSRDKALALGLQATFIGLIPYIPVRLIYNAIIGRFCKYSNLDGECIFFNETVPVFLTLSTIVLILLSIIFSIILYMIIDELEVFCDNEKSTSNLETARNSNVITPTSDDDEIDKAIDDLSANAPFLTKSMPALGADKKDERINKYLEDGDLVPPLTKLNKPESDDSLIELENVGDDHDSEEKLNDDKHNQSLTDINFHETNL